MPLSACSFPLGAGSGTLVSSISWTHCSPHLSLLCFSSQGEVEKVDEVTLLIDCFVLEMTKATSTWLDSIQMQEDLGNKNSAWVGAYKEKTRKEEGEYFLVWSATSSVQRFEDDSKTCSHLSREWWGHRLGTKRWGSSLCLGRSSNALKSMWALKLRHE